MSQERKRGKLANFAMIYGRFDSLNQVYIPRPPTCWEHILNVEDEYPDPPPPPPLSMTEQIAQDIDREIIDSIWANVDPKYLVEPDQVQQGPTCWDVILEGVDF